MTEFITTATATGSRSSATVEIGALTTLALEIALSDQYNATPEKRRIR